jgi:iron complex outermembrane receptor protein
MNTLPKWWKASIYLFGSYERFVYNTDSIRKKTSDFVIQATQNFTITKGLRLELYGSWESPTYFGIKQYKAQWESQAGISQSVFHNNGSIKLMMTDIFNTDEYNYTSHYANLDLTGHEKAGSRFIMATFTYRFGNQSVKNTGKHVPVNTDEQLRLSGSSNEN